MKKSIRGWWHQQHHRHHHFCHFLSSLSSSSSLEITLRGARAKARTHVTCLQTHKYQKSRIHKFTKSNFHKYGFSQLHGLWDTCGPTAPAGALDSTGGASRAPPRATHTLHWTVTVLNRLPTLTQVYRTKVQVQVQVYFILFAFSRSLRELHYKDQSGRKCLILAAALRAEQRP